MDLTWLCFVALISIMIPTIYYGTRSRIQYIHQIREASSRGAFADTKEAKSKSRIRRLAFLSLVGIIGMVLSLILLVEPWIKIQLPSALIVISLIVFGLLTSAAGFLMRREIDFRLKKPSNKHNTE